MAKKIMFSDKYGLTQAVLEGRKTMTRRIVPDRLLKDCVVTGEVLIKSPYKVGEVVAVAQSYENVLEKMIESKGGYGEEENEFYGIHKDTPAWKNKMFVKAGLMPAKIRITDIKVERLQDISDEDCIKEGVIKGKFRDFPNDMFYPYKNCKDTEVSWTAKGAFSKLIDKVSGKGTRKNTPWVFVYSFALIT